MLNWFRLHASRIAATAIVSLTGAGGLILSPHHDDCHDATCWAMAVEHDASAHRIGADTTDSDLHPLHCLVCHWVRSFRPPTEARVLSTPVVETGNCLLTEFFTASAGAPVAQPPLRSPPASPVL